MSAEAPEAHRSPVPRIASLGRVLHRDNEPQAPLAPSDPAWDGPILLFDLELSRPIAAQVPAPRAGFHRRARALLMVHGLPLGNLRLQDLAPLRDPEALLRLAMDEVAGPLAAHLVADGIADVAQAIDPPPCQHLELELPMASVVVPTCGRPEMLVPCIDSLLAQDHPDFEVIVVDNNVRGEDVAELVAGHWGTDPRVRYVRQELGGSSEARNAGLEAARGSIIACTDDDVLADPSWLRWLGSTFERHPDAACVTGLVVPAAVDTVAEDWFEQYGGFSKGYDERAYDLREHRGDGFLYPYTAGQFGSGNNVAFRAEVVRRLGGYDVRFGPGSPIGAAQDLDLFLAVVAGGETLVYQPAAIIRHHHRDTVEALTRQLSAYGRGLAAVMTKWALGDPRHAAAIARRLPAGMRFVLSSDSDKNRQRQATYPRSLVWAELRGLIVGPFAYVRARKHRSPVE